MGGGDRVKIVSRGTTIILGEKKEKKKSSISTVIIEGGQCPVSNDRQHKMQNEIHVKQSHPLWPTSSHTPGRSRFFLHRPIISHRLRFPYIDHLSPFSIISTAHHSDHLHRTRRRQWRNRRPKGPPLSFLPTRWADSNSLIGQILSLFLFRSAATDPFWFLNCAAVLGI